MRRVKIVTIAYAPGSTGYYTYVVVDGTKQRDKSLHLKKDLRTRPRAERDSITVNFLNSFLDRPKYALLPLGGRIKVRTDIWRSTCKK